MAVKDDPGISPRNVASTHLYVHRASLDYVLTAYIRMAEKAGFGEAELALAYALRREARTVPDVSEYGEPNVRR